ncbi:hypothetical protein T03_10953 [Trichinella britovi]|uniref:Uncharacterized protein n=1 Tax=Trichinella britovi TaxID=45882 RepID=A0A0V1C5N8_TRIBR|nr:hypothetical protein T03_2847 [Trichinella britovi]KRY44888.1 hypothetical protein T03_456 [Trichinella britovi]KRY45395.1 hypothetical protein T03_10953 [Trichinella britovi]
MNYERFMLAEQNSARCLFWKLSSNTCDLPYFDFSLLLYIVTFNPAAFAVEIWRVTVSGGVKMCTSLQVMILYEYDHFNVSMAIEFCSIVYRFHINSEPRRYDKQHYNS